MDRIAFVDGRSLNNVDLKNAVTLGVADNEAQRNAILERSIRAYQSRGYRVVPADPPKLGQDNYFIIKSLADNTTLGWIWVQLNAIR